MNYKIPRQTWNGMVRGEITANPILGLVQALANIEGWGADPANAAAVALEDHTLKYGQPAYLPSPTFQMRADLFEMAEEMWLDGNVQNVYGQFRSDFLDFIRGSLKEMDADKRAWFESLNWTARGALEALIAAVIDFQGAALGITRVEPARYELVIVRPNIEHR